MSNLQNTNTSKMWPWVHLVGFIMIFATQMTQYYFSSFYNVFFNDGFAVLVLLCTMYYFVEKCYKDSVETVLLFVYTVWVLITRLISGFYMEGDDLLFIVSMFACLFSFAVAYRFDYKNRQEVFNAFVVLFAALITITCFMGVITAITQKTIEIKFLGYTLQTGTIKGGRLHIADAHPNTSACWAFISMFLIIGRIFVIKKRLWLKTLLIIAAYTDYIAIALTNSRTIYIQVSACLALLVYILITGRKRNMMYKQKILLLLACVILIAPITYKSFDWSIKTVNRISFAFSARSSEVGAETSKLFEKNEPTLLGYSIKNSSVQSGDNRPVFGDKSTLTIRTRIWKSALGAIERNPKLLLVGDSKAKFTAISSELIEDPIDHYHNMFLNVLMLTGIPGLLLVLVFLCLLIKKIIVLLLNNYEKEITAEKLLALPLIGLIGYGATFEVLLFTESDIRAFAFFLVAGVLLADLKDLNIGEQKWR